MKKLLFSVVVVCLTCAMALSLTACTPKAPSASSNSPSSDIASSSKEESTPPIDETTPSSSGKTSSKTASASGKLFASVEEYVKSDEIQTQLATLQDSMKSLGMDMTITGEGNKLVYTYTYAQAISGDAVVKSLKSSLESQASTFKNVAASLKAIVNVDSPVVVVRYLNNDGSELCSQEFAAD